MKSRKRRDQRRKTIQNEHVLKVKKATKEVEKLVEGHKAAT